MRGTATRWKGGALALALVVISLVWWSSGTGSRSGASAAEVRDRQSSDEYSTAVAMLDGSEPLIVTIVPSDGLRPGSTFEVRYAGGSGVFARGPGAGIYSDSGEIVAGLEQAFGGNGPSWSAPGEQFSMVAILLSGEGPDLFVVPDVDPGEYSFAVIVDSLRVDVPLRIH